MRNLRKQCHQTKKRIPLTKKKPDKKGGHGTFLYFFALTVMSTWTPKITLITAVHSYTGKKFSIPFAALHKGVLGEKKVNRRNDRYKILDRELAGGILVL